MSGAAAIALWGLGGLVVGVLIAGAAAMFENMSDAPAVERPTAPGVVGIVLGIGLMLVGAAALVSSLLVIAARAVF